MVRIVGWTAYRTAAGVIVHVRPGATPPAGATKVEE
jgi:hypothetical protein